MKKFIFVSQTYFFVSCETILSLNMSVIKIYVNLNEIFLFFEFNENFRI